MAVSRPATPLDDNVPVGIAWMVVTTFFFVALDACAKHLMADLPVAQVVWARFAFHLIIMSVLLAPRLAPTVRSDAPGLQLLRSGLMLATNGLFFLGLQFSELTVATSIMFLGPIMVTILSVPLLGETVGLRRWTGVILGFAGAMIIIRPGTGFVDIAAVFFLSAAFTHACYQIITRKLRTVDGPMTTLFYTAVVGALVMSAAMPFQWVPPTSAQWAVMATLGACGAVGHFCLIKSLQAAPASAVVPVSYASLLWATLFGFTLFDEWPDLWTVVGAAIIAASGLYIFYREQQLKRRAAAQMATS